MSSKYITPSGFPENLPAVQILEERMKQNMRHVCELFGYVPLETPAVEYMDTLASKGEINKEIFTIGRALAEGTEEKTERGLRFDLTVPFARYTAQHYNDLLFPFKRYQIQKVWRGERPQKGRFREFYQADIDVIANESLPIHFDAEVPAVMSQVLKSFGVKNFTIHVNNRKFLQGLLHLYKVRDTERALQIIDSLDKVGRDTTGRMLTDELSIPSQTALELVDLLSHSVPHDQIDTFLSKIAKKESMMKEGVKEIKDIFQYLSQFSDDMSSFVFSPKIARGLDYYTGSVYETTINGLEHFGSICSGGRYANLAGKFIRRKLPGVGMSIGLSRLLDVLVEERLITIGHGSVTAYVIGLLEESQRPTVNNFAQMLRRAGHNTEVIHSASLSIGKQITAAYDRGAVFVLLNDGVPVKTICGEGTERKEEHYQSPQEFLKTLNK